MKDRTSPGPTLQDWDYCLDHTLCSRYCQLVGIFKDISPRKKAKLSTNETSVENLEVNMQIECLKESKPPELPTPESFASKASVPVSTLQKGTKPIQALLAKNIGNKVVSTKVDWSQLQWWEEVGMLQVQSLITMYPGRSLALWIGVPCSLLSD